VGNSLAPRDGRSKAALLVVDMQNAVVAAACNRSAVVDNIRRLVQKARQERVSVIWVQHADEDLPPGSHAWQIVPELVPDGDEVCIAKHYGDAFEGTGLEALLQEREIGRLFVVGAQTDACIRATLHGGFARGYDVTLVSDAHTTEERPGSDMPTARQVIALTNRYWSRHRAPGRTAAVFETDSLSFA